MLRKGSVTSFVIVEIGWLAFLWVLWLGTSFHTSLSLSPLPAAAHFHPHPTNSTIPILQLPPQIEHSSTEEQPLNHTVPNIKQWTLWLSSLGSCSKNVGSFYLLVVFAVQNGQSRIWFSSGSDVGGGPSTGVIGVGGPSYPQADPVYPSPQ